MFVTNCISTTKIQKISEITNFFRHYFLSRTEVKTDNLLNDKCLRLKFSEVVMDVRDISAKLFLRVRVYARKAQQVYLMRYSCWA